MKKQVIRYKYEDTKYKMRKLQKPNTNNRKSASAYMLDKTCNVVHFRQVNRLGFTHGEGMHWGLHHLWVSAR